jgi:hypothetical protein
VGNAKNDPLSLQLKNQNIIVQPEQPVKEISEAYPKDWAWKNNLWSGSCLGGVVADLHVHTAMPIHI